jgi:hypothetical protein
MRLMKAPRAESHLPKAPERFLRLVIRRQRTLLVTRAPMWEPWIWELSMRLPRRPRRLLQKRRRTGPQRPMRRMTMPLRLLKVPEQMSVVSAAKGEHRAMHHPNPTLRQTPMLRQTPKQLRALRLTKMPARPRARRSRLRQQVAGRVERRNEERPARLILRCTKLRNLPRVSMLTLPQGMMIVQMKTSYRLLARIQANSSRDPATSMIRVRPLNRGLHAA